MERSYFSTMLFLLLHQIDAAYWREWEMFHLPGGIQGFLLFNGLAVPVLLVGYKHVLLRTQRALIYARVCAGLGILTFLIHGGFALADSQPFHLPLSIAIIILCLLSALGMLVKIRSLRER